MSQERVQSTIQPSSAPVSTDPAHQMELFRAISELIVADASPETITRAAADKLVQNLAYQAVQVYRLSPFGNDIWLYIEAGRGLKPVTQNVDIFSIDEVNIISQAAKTQQLQMVPDIQNGPYSYFDQNTPAGGIASEIAVPLLCAEAGYGVLRVQSAIPHAFNRQIQSFLTSVAGLLAGVIKNINKITCKKLTSFTICSATRSLPTKATAAGESQPVFCVICLRLPSHPSLNRRLRPGLPWPRITAV